jgi:hypothetical protein
MKRLSRLLPQKCRVVQYDHLKGKKTFKDVMMGDDCVIILWNLHDKKHRTLNQAGHFFCLAREGGRPIVFSSTGMSPKKELFITQSDPGLFERILPANVTYNKVALQRNKSSNTCWRYCIAFAHLVGRAKLPMAQFTRLFSPLHVASSDALVTLMTFLALH